MEINLNVYHDVQQGGRQYMEDIISIVTNCDASKDTSNLTEKPFACFYVFDGHGGVDAAKFAEKNLHKIIISQEGFYSKDDDVVLKAIKSGFLITHKLMWDVLDTWPRTHMGNHSTSGTTASMVMIRDCKMYVAHVGDSGVVLGEEMSANQWKSNPITIDHKPDCPKEKQRIESIGGSVVIKAGVPRVVWKRQRMDSGLLVNKPPTKESIPFLAVARSLGDLWSYCEKNDGYYVSPEPDMCVYKIDPRKTRCVILASDGLWNAISPSDAVKLVKKCCDNSDELLQGVSRDPANLLVSLALKKCGMRYIKADNTSAIVVLVNPPEGGDSFAEKTKTNGSSIKSCDSSIEKKITCLPFSPLSNFSSCPSLMQTRKSMQRSSSGVNIITSAYTFDDFYDEDYDSFDDDEEEEENDIDNNYIDFYEDEEEDDFDEKEVENSKSELDFCENVDELNSDSIKLDAKKQNNKILGDSENVSKAETINYVKKQEITEVKKEFCSFTQIKKKTEQLHFNGENFTNKNGNKKLNNENEDNNKNESDAQDSVAKTKVGEWETNTENAGGDSNGDDGGKLEWDENNGNEVYAHNEEHKKTSSDKVVNGGCCLKVKFMTKSRRIVDSFGRNDKAFSKRPLVQKIIHSKPIRPLPQISHFMKKSPIKHSDSLLNRLNFENSLKENKVSPKEFDKNTLSGSNLKQKSANETKSGVSFYIGSVRKHNTHEDTSKEDFNLLELCKAAYDGLQTYNDKPTPQKPVCFLDSQTSHSSSFHRLTNDEKVSDAGDNKSGKNQPTDSKDLKQQYTSIKTYVNVLQPSSNNNSVLQINCAQKKLSLNIPEVPTASEPSELNGKATINTEEASEANTSLALTFTKKCKNVAHKRKLGVLDCSPLRKRCKLSEDAVEIYEVVSADCVTEYTSEEDSTNNILPNQNLQLNTDISKNEETTIIKNLATSIDQTSLYEDQRAKSCEKKIEENIRDENANINSDNREESSIAGDGTASENIRVEDKDNNLLLRVEACA